MRIILIGLKCNESRSSTKKWRDSAIGVVGNALSLYAEWINYGNKKGENVSGDGASDFLDGFRGRFDECVCLARVCCRGSGKWICH